MKYVLISVAAALLCYLAAGFILNDLTPSHWEQTSREKLIGAIVFSAAFGCVIRAAHKDIRCK